MCKCLEGHSKVCYKSWSQIPAICICVDQLVLIRVPVNNISKLHWMFIETSILKISTYVSRLNTFLDGVIDASATVYSLPVRYPTHTCYSHTCAQCSVWYSLIILGHNPFEQSWYPCNQYCFWLFQASTRYTPSWSQSAQFYSKIRRLR